MSEPEKVLCPYCGREMRLGCGMCGIYMFECSDIHCQAQSPRRLDIETARAAALKRYKPMQKPLTLEEVNALEFPFPLWVEYKEMRFDNGENFSPEILYGILEDGFIDIGYDWINPAFYQSTLRFWRDKPTDAEREAAKWW